MKIHMIDKRQYIRHSSSINHQRLIPHIIITMMRNPDQALLQQSICNLFWICMIVHLTVGLPFGPLPWGAIIGFVVETTCTCVVAVIASVCVRCGIVLKLWSMIFAFAVESAFSVVLTIVALMCMHWGFILMICSTGFLYYPSVALLRYMGKPVTFRNIMGTTFYMVLVLYLVFVLCIMLSCQQPDVAVIVCVVIVLITVQIIMLVQQNKYLYYQINLLTQLVNNHNAHVPLIYHQHNHYAAPDAIVAPAPPAIPAQSVQPAIMRPRTRAASRSATV